MSTQDLERKLEDASRKGRLPKVVIPVHLTGQPCDMRTIHELSKKYGFAIIEDGSHAAGASFLGSPVGACEFSDIAVFSFHPVKIFTTGEGGAALTNSLELAERMRELRSHGITRDRAKFALQSQSSYYYEQHELGFNYRITDFQAALGISQLRRLDSFVSRRREIARYYDSKFRESEIQLPFQEPTVDSSWHLYVVRLTEVSKPNSRDRIFEDLRKRGIGVNLHYIPVYRHPYYARFGYNQELFPNSESYYAQAISIPIFPDLTKLEQDEVAKTLLELLS
jgi:dTDP-4-amino-4,6-dideoxygalactose transaminase